MANQYYATVNETAFAKYFLKALGSKQGSNVLLILAVVSWMRMTTGGKKGKGYNLLSLKSNGKLIKYSSYQSAATAAAKRLLRGGSDEWLGYGRIVAAARKNGGTTTKGRARAAEDFIRAVVISQWDSQHYGGGHVEQGPYGSHWVVYDQHSDRLLQLYSKMQGIYTVTWVTPPPEDPPPKQKIPPKPRTFHVAPIIEKDYLRGSETKGFYDERHPYGLNVLPAGLDGTI